MFYFTLGFLTIFALIIIGVLIVGMIKLYRLNQELQDEKINFRGDVEGIFRLFEEKNRDWRETVDSIYRELDRRIDSVARETISYTDKRIDTHLLRKKD